MYTIIVLVEFSIQTMCRITLQQDHFAMIRSKVCQVGHVQQGPDSDTCIGKRNQPDATLCMVIGDRAVSSACNY
jgi:hypothetical protein